MKKKGIHIEITNLVVPEIGDSEKCLQELASWIYMHLGAETPFHILRFYPSYELVDLPLTPLSTIENAVKIAQKEGLRYVYSGNVQSHKGENTYCPTCHHLLVRRDSFNIVNWNLTKEMNCPKCGEKIPIKGVYHRLPVH
jgi:pyruvate formate lyase activating enzyme